MLPKLTHLQFLVLYLLAHQPDGMLAGDLRHRLQARGESRRGPAFYQMMRRMESEGLITAVQIPYHTLAWVTVFRTRYTLTPAGMEASQEVVRFYCQILSPTDHQPLTTDH